MTGTQLSVLVIDTVGESRDRLVGGLRRMSCVTKVAVSEELSGLDRLDSGSEVNTVFIDPLLFDLDDAAKAIFSVRARVPQIVFVLYMNVDDGERRRHDLFAGERRRFLHYYRLNKGGAVAEFIGNLEVSLDLCRYDLDWQISKDSIELVRARIQEVGNRVSQEVIEPILRDIGARLSQLRRRGSAGWSKVHDRSVFLSYTFAEAEMALGLRQLLEQHNFSVVTGDDTNTYISEAIQHRIETASLFICLMTRVHGLSDGSYLPSLWLVEEKAIAIAANKHMVLMVEEGVQEIGALQSDYQRIVFSTKNFTTAALKAVRQLESYVGSTEPSSAS